MQALIYRIKVLFYNLLCLSFKILIGVSFCINKYWNIILKKVLSNASICRVGEGE